MKYRWEDGTWRVINMVEGFNQGCPLSGIFAALVLDSILRPLDKLMKDRAAKRLHDGMVTGDVGDDGHGSVTHAMGYVDDVTPWVPLVDLKFYMDELDKRAKRLGGFIGIKTRIMTSCNGESILDSLEGHELHDSVKEALYKWSISTPATSNSEAQLAEITTGFRLLGTPVGSAEYAEQFFEKKVEEVHQCINALHN